MAEKKLTILGQDPKVLVAMLANIISWIVSTAFPSYIPKLLPTCAEEDNSIVGNPKDGTNSNGNMQRTKCVSIGRPGGLEQLRVIYLKQGIVTVGYNVTHFCKPPFTPSLRNDWSDAPADCVILQNRNFSVNYADCAIRWGLYESANRFVGWPIVPGFDVAGEIEHVKNSPDDNENVQFTKGDRVFGVTLFGSYSNQILIPKIQLRKIPNGLSFAQAASLPTVSLTALYALSLAGYFPVTDMKYANNSILIHSAAGGVGSMLVQISKLLGLSPIIGVVGRTEKVREAKALGCDMVIDKSKEDLWSRAEELAPPDGYKTIMDANGVSTLQQSYDHLAPTGRLIVFGFHSNLPLGRDMLSPMEWIRMAKKMNAMPKFDAMDLVVDNKAVMGFNLSFFAGEAELVSVLFDKICQWVENGQLKCPQVVTREMSDIGEAHTLIQSGCSIGKIVINTT